VTARAPRPRDDSGTSAIELAILAPLLIMLIFGLVQIGLWAYGRSVALQAAQEGVAQIRLIQPSDANADQKVATAVADTQTYASSIGGQGLIDPRVAPAPVYSTPELGQPTRVTVTVTGHVMSLVPGWTFTVTRSASGELEQFRAGP
jgi:Flp pilus assembly protein TadG